MSQKRSKNSNKSEDSRSGNKKQKVRGEKRYRFKNFNERIEEIDISSIQRIGGYRGTGPESTESTWFELNLDAWKELNCSAAFAKFCYAVTPLTGTLPKLLFNRERIVDEIFKVLKAANKDGPESATRLALIPVLSLTAMLAKDLGSEFHCHFREFFNLLLPVLPLTGDPEIIEAAFASLLYVFKCLLDDLLADLPGTFDMVVKPLLDVSSLDSQGHLRRFGSECFGYLLRKSLKIGSSGFFEAVETSPKGSSVFVADCFVAAILDESTGRFRTCLKPLVLEIYSHVKVTNSLIWCDILRFIAVKLLDETDLTTNAPLWKILVQFLSEDDCHVTCLTRVLIDSFAYRRGTRVQLHSTLLPGLFKLESIELCVHLLRSMNLEITLQNRQLVMKLIDQTIRASNSIDLDKLLSLCRGVVQVNWLHYDLILADFVRSYMGQIGHVNVKVIELLEIILAKYPNASSSLPSIPKLLSREILETNSRRALKILIEHFPRKFPVELFSHFQLKFCSILKGDSELNREELSLCIQVLKISDSQVFEFHFDEEIVMNFAYNLKFPEQFSAIALVLSRSPVISFTSSLLEIAANCLRSCSSEWRLEALILLKVLLASDAEFSEIVKVLEEVEGIPCDLENYREKLLKLKKLEHIPLIKNSIITADTNSSTKSSCAKLILNYLLGFIQIKLSLLWPEACRIISKYSAAFPTEFSQLATTVFQAVDPAVEEEKNNSQLVVSEPVGYDFDIDDEGLINLNRIKSIIEVGDLSREHDQRGIVPVLSNQKLIIPAVLKLFASHPEACPEDFKENFLIHLTIETFSNPNPRDSSKLLQSNLGSILQCLSGTKLSSNTKIEEIYMKFLSHGDLQIQNRSLECIFNTKRYGGALSNQWKSRLKSLLNDNLFREELTNLTSEAESLSKVAHWHNLLAPLMIRILFGRFIARKGAGAGRHSLPLRRKMILNCFGTWEQGSLALIVDFLLTRSEDKSDADNNTSRQQLGFLNLLEDVFGSLGRKKSMDRLIERLIQIGVETSLEIEDETEIEELEESAAMEIIESEATEIIESEAMDIIESEAMDIIESAAMEIIESEALEIIESEALEIIESEAMDIIESEAMDIVESESHTGEGVETEIVQSNSMPSMSQDRRVRQLVMKRLLQLFKLFESSALKRLSPFLPDLFDRILNPRISQLSTHFTNSTSSSALLEILVCAAVNLPEEDLMEMLSKLSPELWSRTVEAFSLDSTKPLIISQLLGFFEGLLKHSQKNPLILKSMIIPDMERLLDAFDKKLKSPSLSQFPLILRILALVQILSPHVTCPEQAARLCKTFEGLLKVKWVNEGMRTHLIGSMTDLLKTSKKISKSLFEIVSAQWNVLKGRPGRESLCKLFDGFSELTPVLFQLSELLRDLNSWLPGKLGEPDFDKRLSAFAVLKKLLDSGEFKHDVSVDSVDTLVPITWSMIYFLNDIDELSIRNQSFAVLKSIIKVLESEDVSERIVTEDTADATDDTEETEDIDASNITATHSAPGLIQRIILPSIKIGIKSRVEVIRIEFVALLDLLISSFPSCPPFSSLSALICPIESSETLDMDEENIFRNIYHIQEPRRNRAIRQIGELAVDGKLIGLTRGMIEDLLLPLILPTTLPDPHGEIEFAVSEAMQKDSIVTCGALIAQLPWKSFLRKLIQFVKEISENKRSDQWNRTVLRLLPSMISQFKFVDTNESGEFVDKINADVIPAMFRLLHKSESTNPASENSQKKLMKTASGAPLAASVDKISVKHSLRVPIAISIGQLIKLVSHGSLDSPVVVGHLPRLLTELLNVLKQKDADTRDVARSALVRIMGIFGTAFLPFLLKEARTLLNRGYQRHVLTFTAHAILVEFLRLKKQTESENVREGAANWNLDSSADLLVDMALASSFGFQAAERVTIEWSGKQPEVRAAKGPEIIALTAQFTSQPVLEKSLIRKLTQLALLDLGESTAGVNTRGTGALDEKSEAIDRIEGESFELLTRALFLNGLNPLLARDHERLPALLASMYEILSYPCDSGSRSHLFRLQSRAFEFISHILNNFKEESMADLMGRIIPFIELTRVYILEKGKHVIALTSAITLFNQFIAYKSLHPSITDLQPLLQKLFTIILKGNSGNSEGAAQLSAAYKLTSTLIRDWSDLEVTDTQIKALIEYTRLQLDNPHQQSLTFSLIRSLISRQIVLLQLFELMETVRSVMLTSHHPSTRQQCRSVYLHFLTNYPMATKKLEEQLDFLLANVRYEFATGRESCVEVMRSLIGKLSVEIIENISEAWFLGLTVQLAKENSSDGSVEVGAAILSTLSAIFVRLPAGKRRDNLELLLLRWITQSPKLSVQGAAWRIVLPLLKEVSRDSRNNLLEKGIEIIADESTPEDLLLLVLKASEDAIKEDLCPEDAFERILVEASDARFFKEDCEFKSRHSIALLWNSILI